MPYDVDRGTWTPNGAEVSSENWAPLPGDTAVNEVTSGLQNDAEAYQIYKSTFKGSDVNPPSFFEWRFRDDGGSETWAKRLNPSFNVDESQTGIAVSAADSAMEISPGWKPPVKEPDAFDRVGEKVRAQLGPDVESIYSAMVADPELERDDLPLPGETQAMYVQRHMRLAEEDRIQAVREAQEAAQRLDERNGPGTAARLGQQMLEQQLVANAEDPVGMQQAINDMNSIFDAYGIDDAGLRDAISDRAVEVAPQLGNGLSLEDALIYAIQEHVGTYQTDDEGYFDEYGDWIPYD